MFKGDSGKEIKARVGHLYTSARFMERQAKMVLRYLRDEMKIRMVSKRKLIEIVSKTIPSHLKQFVVKELVSYTETEAEMLVKYLSTSKLMTISMLELQDEATEDNPEPEKYEYFTLCITEELDAIKEEDMKLIELEINLYQMSDAVTEMDGMRIDVEEKIKECVDAKFKTQGMSLLATLAYVQEVWANLTRSIQVTEEEI